MATKKWTDKRDQFLGEVLSLLRMYEGVLSIRQGSYKEDFFKVFVDAFHAKFCVATERFDVASGRMVRCKNQRPLITPDSIWSYAKDHDWCHAEMTVDEKRYRNIQMVMTWWEEWTYAWERNPPKPRRKRSTAI